MAPLNDLFHELISQYKLTLIEALLVILVIPLAAFAPRIDIPWLRAAESKFSRFARRRLLAVVTVGLLALAVRAAILPFEPIPVPGTHDEFSYLLAADTFAHGRLTNPTHPLWPHFESFHIIQQPSYQSMYPIAQSLLMALGKVIMGHPWWGVWLMTGLFCSALCWMLQAWLPPQWALLGGLLAVIRIAWFSYWMNSYFGGSAAGVGGALLLGALPRIIRSQRIGHTLLFGVGVALLANSRPNEGLFITLGALLVIAVWIVERRPPARVVLGRIGLPFGLVMALMILAMGFYFWRVTGNPLRMPYQVDRAQYATAPLYLFLRPQPEPQHNHVVMRDFYRWELDTFERTRSVRGVFIRTAGKLITLWLFFFGPALSLPLIMLPRVLRDKRLRLLLLAAAVGSIGLLITPWFNAHYAAPMAGVIYAVLLQGLRHLRFCRWRGRETGLMLARAVPLICIVLVPIRLAAAPLHIETTTDWRASWCCGQPGLRDRAELLGGLQDLPGRQLVIVRYKPDHDFHTEWVYNEADIDNAKVVWAREMSGPENEKLINYFSDRKVWLLEADETPPRLTPYPRGLQLATR